LRTVIATVWAVITCTLFIQAGNGLQTDIIGLRADTAFSSGMVGLMMASYYAGYCIGPLLGHAIISRIGHASSIILCVLLAAGVIAIQPLVLTVPAWIGFRVVSGFALSLCYVAIESWIQGGVTNVLRGRVFGLYMFVQIAGMTFAQGLLNLCGAKNYGPFALAAVLFAIAAVPILAARDFRPPEVPPRPLKLSKLFHHAPLGAFATVFSGLSWAILFSFGPVYAKRVGFDVSGVGLFMGLAMAAGGMLQLPIGWLSDKVGRRGVIELLFGVGCLAGLFGVSAHSSAAILAAAALEGACVFPIYAVAAAHVNDSISQSARIAAAAGLVLLFGMGSLLGPAVCGWIMSAFGSDGFFALLAATMALGLLTTVYLHRSEETAVRIT
jgi:MFS family permease